MSVSNHLSWGGLVALGGALLVGCIPYPRERPRYIDLCQSEYTFTVDGPNGKQEIVLETYIYDHGMPGNHMPDKRSSFTIPHVQGLRRGRNFMSS